MINISPFWTSNSGMALGRVVVYKSGMKYMALDYGIKRVGVAVTDSGGSMVFPRCTLHRTTRDVFFAELVQLIAREQPYAVVVGLPLHLDGTEGLTTRQVRNFVGSLKRRTGVPLYWMEEALSSHEAERDLRDAGLDGKAVAKVVDQQAAVRILESFLSQPEALRKTA